MLRAQKPLAFGQLYKPLLLRHLTCSNTLAGAPVLDHGAFQSASSLFPLRYLMLIRPFPLQGTPPALTMPLAISITSNHITILTVVLPQGRPLVIRLAQSLSSCPSMHTGRLLSLSRQESQERKTQRSISAHCHRPWPPSSTGRAASYLKLSYRSDAQCGAWTDMWRSS